MRALGKTFLSGNVFCNVRTVIEGTQSSMGIRASGKRLAGRRVVCYLNMKRFFVGCTKIRCSFLLKWLSEGSLYLRWPGRSASEVGAALLCSLYGLGSGGGMCITVHRRVTLHSYQPIFSLFRLRSLLGPRPSSHHLPSLGEGCPLERRQAGVDLGFCLNA